MDIFREENWGKWEAGAFSFYEFRRLDEVKDRWLITWIAFHGREKIRKIARERMGGPGALEMPVNIDDVNDDQYFSYLVLREQVERESDYWVLKHAVFHAPEPMSRFAFCRLTGCSWPPDRCDAYSYRTYNCGLKRDVTREDIEDLCREMIEKKGPFPQNARRWLKELKSISDEELARMASAKTERRFDREPDRLTEGK